MRFPSFAALLPPFGLVLGALLAASGTAVAALPWSLPPGHDTPAYWLDQARDPERVLVDAAGVAAMNARTFDTDPAVFRLDRLPTQVPGTEVRGWILALGTLPEQRYDESGRKLGTRARARLERQLALGRIDSQVTPTFALATRRADLRALPTPMRLARLPGETDLDRLQESTLFPGDAVAILHTSRDGQWRFVVGALYRAWVAADALAAADRETILGFGAREPSLVVTGARARSVFDPAIGATRELEMGTRLPWLSDWPLDEPVSGQLPVAHHVIAWPTRDATGKLDIVPVLFPRQEPLAAAPLPLSRANIVRQGFLFLGERYGWGHGYDGRDCSGFVAEIFRSMGVVLPRNTGDQARSTALHRTEIAADDDRARRLALLRSAQPGDLLYLPGHVMLLLGFVGDEPWVLHDTHVPRVRDGDALRPLPLNGVVVTPLSPLLGEDGQALLDRLTVIQSLDPLR